MTTIRWAMLGTAMLAVSWVFAGENLHEEAAIPYEQVEDRGQVPFGETMPAVVENYGRATPSIATGGMITEDAMTTFRDQGMRTVVSLLTAEEGVDRHREWAQDAGIAYRNISVTGDGPGDEQVRAFREILADPDNYPIMVHCASANRVGSLWARYRIAMGVPVTVAFQEGRTIGLKPELEATVRAQLDH